MSPEESKIMAGFFISVFEQEAGTTARVIKAIPENNQHYRPDPQSRTALELARHIVLEDVWLLDAVIDLEFKPLPDQTDACGIMTPLGIAGLARAAPKGRLVACTAEQPTARQNLPSRKWLPLASSTWVNIYEGNFGRRLTRIHDDFSIQ